MKIIKDMLVFPCGCEFKILDKNIPIRLDIPTDYNVLNHKCQATWDLFAEGNTKGVFQLEGRLGKQLSKDLKPISLEHLSALTAIMRPSALEGKLEGKSITQHYIDRKNGKDEIKTFHPALEPILKNTYQMMVYQEDVMNIAKEIAGFTMIDAAGLLKGISKKKKDVIMTYKEKFIDGCAKVGKVNDKEAKEIFEWIAASARYSFNHCLDWDTLVELEDGSIIKLFYVKIGQKIKCLVEGSSEQYPKYTKIYQNKYVKVTGKYYNGIKQTFKTTLENGYQICSTIDHKFFCNDGKMHPLWEILLYTRNNGPNGESLQLEIAVGPYLNYPIEKVEDNGLIETMDIRVDDPLHCFYANGIATSNSHSISYGMNTFTSAYMKVHFPRSFFTSYLYYAKDKGQKRFDEIKLLVSNAKSMNINVHHPRLSHNYKHFTRDKYDICFGFTDIRDMGESAFREWTASIELAETVLNKKVTSFTWLEFLVFVSQTVKSNGLRGIIECGALDIYKIDRQRMLYEYAKFCEITSREQTLIKQNINIAGEKDAISLIEKALLIPKFCNKARVKKVHDILNALKTPPYSLVDTPDWLARVEEARLGVSLTCSIIDGCKNADQANSTCQDFNDGNCRSSGIFIAGQIEEISITQTKTGKNPGQEMAFITFGDSTGSLAGVVFPGEWEKIKKDGSCIEDNLVMIAGERGNKPGSMIIKNIWQLT